MQGGAAARGPGGFGKGAGARRTRSPYLCRHFAKRAAAERPAPVRPRVAAASYDPPSNGYSLACIVTGRIINSLVFADNQINGCRTAVRNASALGTEGRGARAAGGILEAAQFAARLLVGGAGTPLEPCRVAPYVSVPRLGARPAPLPPPPPPPLPPLAPHHSPAAFAPFDSAILSAAAHQSYPMFHENGPNTDPCGTLQVIWCRYTPALLLHDTPLYARKTFLFSGGACPLRQEVRLGGLAVGESKGHPAILNKTSRHVFYSNGNWSRFRHVSKNRGSRSNTIMIRGGIFGLKP
ncbi:hypothetical protein EVAR_79423_1 [Eumeta japonica]|uniref:Uncharacterized protein n=1 Tax=Eumeta variegata TaxID=151549 RepID=A0A4C1VFV3_EUMVA|nr:hypothetical protein EVAR_79423_1 [Eumeta japonica]